MAHYENVSTSNAQSDVRLSIVYCKSWNSFCIIIHDFWYLWKIKCSNWSEYFSYISQKMKIVFPYWQYSKTSFINSIFSSLADPKGHVSYCHHWASVVRPLSFHILINSSEATGPIWTKLWWNSPWMVPLQNCVRWSRLPTKMAAKLKIEKKGGWNFNCPLLL